MISIDNSSFRDYHSLVGYDGSKIKRLLHIDYIKHYRKLIDSGLYDNLVQKKLLVAHDENKSNFNVDYTIELTPQTIPFISYPYEWSFNQLKDAAILTLEINKIALEYGMILKDSSVYNVQFYGSKPIFIDTASFEIYDEGKPWSAYQQFCRHFLAPLALCSYKDLNLKQLFLSNIDGIPLALCNKLLPRSSLLNLGIFLHIWLNALGLRTKSINKSTKLSTYKQSKAKVIAIQEHLLSTIKKLNWKLGQSQWANYYVNTNYSKNDEIQKESIVSLWVGQLGVSTILDLGANDGRYSRLLAKQADLVISTDYDETAIELNYLLSKKMDLNNVQTLHLDFANPAPAIGFANCERKSFLQRVDVDLILALALIHHLVITHDLPFEKLASQLAKMTRFLIIEFPQREDEKVIQISQAKPYQYKSYTHENFINSFGQYFNLKSVEVISGNNRSIYLYERKVEA